LDSQQLKAILKHVRQEFDLLPDSEITAEANPADLNLTFLEVMRAMGINRLNIGVQSFDEKVLHFLGRRHSPKEGVLAINNARRAGFDNIGLDLIYAVPGQDIKSWLDTLNGALAFTPEHLSCYQLTVEPHTPLGMRCQRGEFTLPGEELEREFFMKTAERLEEAGYVHYEVSNFARGAVFASRHNQKYWNHTSYLGLGPSAHSYEGDQRWWNFRSLDQYITATRKGERPVQGTEDLSMEQLRLEALYFGLRTKKGIYLREFADRYQCDLLKEREKVLAQVKDEGLISIEGGHLFPTSAGLALADSLTRLLASSYSTT